MMAGIPDMVSQLLFLQAASSKLTKSKWDESKTKLSDRPAPRPTRDSPLLKAPAARPRTVTVPPRERRTTPGKDECRTSKPVTAPPSQQKPSSKTQLSIAALTVQIVCFLVEEVKGASHITAYNNMTHSKVKILPNL